MAQGNTTENKVQFKPLSCSYVELYAALTPLHLHNKMFTNNLHDVWLKGAPTPDSRILNPKGYDPRLRQRGNVEKRLVLPQPLFQWVKEVIQWRGMQDVTDAQIWRMLLGK
jgi:hypothetical protein